MAVKRQYVDKKDPFRALLTDTACGDVPIVFSNDGFYINTIVEFGDQKNNSLIFDSIYKNTLIGNSQSAPYKYQINKKNGISTRKLSLIHPRAQLNFCNFYAEYSNLILYFCSKSEASIRTPYKVSNSLFLKEGASYSPYKEVDIDTIDDELFRRHASSFFSYKDVNLLYKFFKKDAYYDLEKKFSVMRILDIANCFDSIYTHTIAWAVKDKEYNKKFIDFQNQFSVTFDKLVQRSNNNETNGIPIGSEVSRIFAEIIFQKIDQNIIQSLQEKFSYIFSEDYYFARYVDDYIVFSNSEDKASNISHAISDELSRYNLYINDNKIESYSRPFFTKKSNVTTQAHDCLNDLFSTFFKEKNDENPSQFRPKNLVKESNVVKDFINHIKSSCYLSENATYLDVSSYLISCLSKKLISFVDNDELRNHFGEEDEKKQKQIKWQSKKIIFATIEIMFFFYLVNPQSKSSNKMAKTILIVDKFFKQYYEEYSDSFRVMVMNEISSHFPFDNIKNNSRDNFITLENLNILLATSEFGENYLLSETKLEEFLSNCEKVGYFEIISLLYYIKNINQFQNVKHKIEALILKIISDKKHALKSCSETTHLFLDCVSCPFLSLELRKKILEQYLSQYESGITYSEQEVHNFLNELKSKYWFVKWEGLNLIKLLERKELNASY